MTTATNRVLEVLSEGTQLTSKQIASRFSVAAPRSIIRNLRQAGYPIYLNRKVDSKGRVTQKYRLGTPSRAMIAFAFQMGFQQAN